jgi:hypothetical protein
MVKGKWAQGIVPRNFRWVLKDQIAVCERPGGYGENHRRVRREEEIIWIKQQEFTCVISLIPSPHNLHNYEEHEVAYLHRPLGSHDDKVAFLRTLYPEFKEMTSRGGKVLLHMEELGELVSGIMAGYLLWDGLIPTGPQTISVAERLFERHLGPPSRELVTIAEGLVAEGGAPASSS